MSYPTDAKCVFVGGVHGMGKSSLCTDLANALGIGHYVASELIKRHRDLDQGLYKEVRNVSKNQEILLSAIQRFVGHSRYILDGHFVIRAEKSGLSRIPYETYAAIRPMMIIVVTGDIETACRRLKERDGKDISPAQLSEMQAMEIEHAKDVSARLQIPFYAHPNSDSAGIRDALTQALLKAK